ncbi:MAG: ubiquinone/menaquinone biosynthesis methyltransferase [Deltaproteobacteria bacterium]|nr:ubiquinone/menaquinone biosynthesis methyltransferase [Deltaproteobacteria bacterium]
MVREVFSSIHRRYDLLNRLFSLRRDVAWRRFAAGKMHFFRAHRLLDVATGTGDLAIETARLHRNIGVVGVDFVRPMMEMALMKLSRHRLSQRVLIVQADALNLPFPDDHFDVVGIAFGIRNISERSAALAEMMRVAVPGGQVMVLEMHFPKSPFFSWFYRTYFVLVLPRAARFFSRNPAAYHYLADSIADFPTPKAFVDTMQATGLIGIETYALSFGITHLYVGLKPEKAAEGTGAETRLGRR